MKENKAKKEQKKETGYHSMHRMFLLTFPMTVSFFVLMLFRQIAPLSALIGFGLTLFFTFLFSIPFLKELEILIDYLKQEAEGKQAFIKPHSFKKRREAFKIVQSFNQIKLRWLNKTRMLEAQTLSDTAILEQMPEPVLLMNKEGDFVWQNLAAKKIFSEKIIHRNANDFTKERVLLDAVRRILSHQTENEQIEFSLQIKGKKNFFKAIMGWLPALAKNGGEVVVVLHNITQFKIFEKTQNAFFANASHELKTPLSVLSGFIETLQGPAKNDAEARDKFLNIMKEQTVHMTNLVQNLLALSRMNLDDKTPLENVVIPDLVRSVFQALELKAKLHQKELCLRENTVLPPIKAHSAELFRVIQNLVDNAIKYGQDDTKITIALDITTQPMPQPKPEHYIPMQILTIKVHNEGEPIPEEEIPHLFERFYRMESNRQITGTGLGLAIAYEIIHNKYQGNITIESTKSTGTIFTVSMPVALQ